METRLSNMERKVDTLVKSHDTLAQVLTRIEIQLNQQGRQRGTVPSQPLPNPRNPRQANEAQDVGPMAFHSSFDDDQLM